MTPFARALGTTMLLVAVPPVYAQPPAQRPITGEGTEGFRALIASHRLIPLEKTEDLYKHPGQTLLIAFRGANQSNTPYPDQVGKLIDEHGEEKFVKYINNGGALFFASDQAMEGQAWGPRLFGFEIKGPKLQAASHETARCYERTVECPFVQRPRGNSVPDLFQGRALGPNIGAGPANRGPLQRVATNRPSYLEPASELHLVGVFAPVCETVAIAGVRSIPMLRNYVPEFAQAKRYDDGGKVLVLSDHSVFINRMLLPQRGDNDNLAFAMNCLDWLLLGPDSSPRRYVMFMEDGRIWKRSDYNLALQTLPAPNAEDIAQFLWDNRALLWENRDKAEDLLAAIEESGVFLELEKGDPIGESIRDSIAGWAMVRVVLALFTIAILGYGIMSLIRWRFGYSKRTPRLALALDRARPRVSLLEQRLRGDVTRGQYDEVAREKARQLFESLPVAPAPEGEPPHVAISVPFWRRGRVERNLREAWTLAYADDPPPVPAREWARIKKSLSELQLAFERGSIRFEDPREHS